MESLQVLLIAYYNYGMSKNKNGDNEYARRIFKQGKDISKKY